MKNYIQLRTISILLLLLILCQSCISTRVVSEYDNDSIIKHHKTSWSYAWGLVTPKDINPECESKKMNAVTSKTNLGYILISAITLGIVVPQTIEWECAPVETPIEDL
ncbi:hypothetical protein J8L88_05200 [Aquimarina sp. MMG015]|uniref:hypothetical protein n=1 Tax=Aquimarina TaxID=290174 RepID=UPI00041853A3|nr:MULTISPECIES: hypothetical protein [Aquimarina]MBQ4802244.1 hypothetical protein [Aquimarina sp. MMG015]